MNCDQALVGIVEADLATLFQEDTVLGQHVHACERCRAVVDMLHRETGALTSLVATMPFVVPTVGAERARASRRHVLGWVSLAAVTGTVLFVVQLRAPADKRTPMVAQRPSTQPVAAPPPTAPSAPAPVPSVANRTMTLRVARQRALTPTPRPTATLDAVPIPLSPPIVAQMTVAEPTMPVPVTVTNDVVPADSSRSAEQDAVARHTITLPQSNPRVTVLWLSPTLPRLFP
jgi:hypothetical protein